MIIHTGIPFDMKLFLQALIDIGKRLKPPDFDLRMK